MPDLSEQDKSRILQEEQQRVGEEQYRQQVRQELSSGTQAAPKTNTNTKSPLMAFAKFVLLVIPLYVAWLFFGSALHNSGGASSILRPSRQPLFSGEIVVAAAQYRYQTFTVTTTAMVNPRVVGSFHASGGMGNDIQVVLAEKSEFENWANGHKARVLYSTEKETSGHMNVPITQPGTYYLAFSNTFSLLTQKHVDADIELQYLMR